MPPSPPGKPLGSVLCLAGTRCKDHAGPAQSVHLLIFLGTFAGLPKLDNGLNSARNAGAHTMK